jgi:hypothetical protein
VRTLPRRGDFSEIASQAAAEANLPIANELLVIFLDFVRQIAVIDGNPKGSFQTVGSQVAEGVDSFQTSAIRKVK